MPFHRRHLILLYPMLLIGIFSYSQQGRQDTLILHFPFDSHHIQTDDRTRLLQSFHYSIVDSVLITGYTDKIGTTAYNQSLSEDRANAVLQCLTAPLHTPGPLRHSNPKNWNVLGRGIAPTPDRTDSENRRVEVVVYYHPPDSAIATTQPHYDTISRANREPVASPPTRPTDSIVVVKHGPIDGAATTDSTQPSTILALHRINFIVDTPVPTDSTRQILPQLIAELQQYKERHLEIDGYVNSIAPLHGKNDPLFKLSVNRAKFIYNCLVEAGFNSANLTYKGLGNSTPVNPHPTTRDEMNANMRVEIKVF